jgi:hypothetical protein
MRSRRMKGDELIDLVNVEAIWNSEKNENNEK